MSVCEFDDQLLQVICPETILEEQKKNSLKLSKPVSAEASCWCLLVAFACFSCLFWVSAVFLSNFPIDIAM